MEILTDPKYFENTRLSLTKTQAGRLLLVVDWDPTIEFIYETYSVFVYDNNTNQVTKEKDRLDKTNKEIIKEYIKYYKRDNPPTYKRKPEKILAMNPEEYPPEAVLSQML